MSAAQKVANDQMLKNLQRENAMIATAWYDLTSRLQSNHVVLQRRQDMPKSWLNKQRQMVNGMISVSLSVYPPSLLSIRADVPRKKTATPRR